MKICIVVATSDAQLADHVGRKKLGIVPREFVDAPPLGGSSTLSVQGFLAGAASPLEPFLTRIMHDAHAVILLADAQLTHVVQPFRDALFLAAFDSGLEGMSPDNYFRRLLARALKNFRFYGAQFFEAKYQKVLLLPFENFAAVELANLRNTFWNDSLSSDFGNTLSRHLVALRERQIPKRQASYKRTYLKDDLDNYFEYGHEHHALPDTAVPPHRVTCELNSVFRFGLRYDKNRHFNVSKEKQPISGTFIDCHDVQRHTSERTHINMFPNRFH